LTLQRAARVVDVGTQAAAAELGEDRQRLLGLGDDEDLDRRRLGADPLALGREHEPLDPGPEPDRRRRRAADLLDQVVVAARPADRRLRALLGPAELERR